VAAEFLHQIEAEVDRGVDAAAAQQPAVLGDELLGLPEHFRIVRAEDVGHAPMRRRTPAVEQSGLGQERDVIVTMRPRAGCDK
jgi:hypothetical protein